MTYLPNREMISEKQELEKKVAYYKKLLNDASHELGVANKAILKCDHEWMDRGIKIGLLEVDNKNLSDEIKSVRAEHSQAKQELETAVQILNGYIYGNDVHNEAVNFVQAYFNKHNIFPYEP